MQFPLDYTGTEWTPYTPEFLPWGQEDHVNYMLGFFAIQRIHAQCLQATDIYLEHRGSLDLLIDEKIEQALTHKEAEIQQLRDELEELKATAPKGTQQELF